MIVTMLQYEKIDVSEGTDVNKANALKECELCHYWFFKDAGFKFEPYFCNKCHDVLMTAYELKNIAILNVKGVYFRCILWGISRDGAVNWLNNSMEKIRVSCKMEFGANKTPVKVIKEGVFGGSYFRDTYLDITGNWYKKPWKEFDQLKNIDQNFYCSTYYDVCVHKYDVKYGISLRFWENNGWIDEIDLYGWFQWYFRYLVR